MADRIPKCPKCRKLAQWVRQKTTETVAWTVTSVGPVGDTPLYAMGWHDKESCVIATCGNPACRHEWCPKGVTELQQLQPDASKETP